MDSTDYRGVDALVATAKIVIDMQGGRVTVAELAKIVSKCSKFLFPQRYRGEQSFDEFVDRENAAMRQLIGG